MADEILRANQIRVERIGKSWLARIGPDDGSGLLATGTTGEDAVNQLTLLISRCGWVWDESWRDTWR